MFWFCSETGNRIILNELILMYIVSAFLETRGQVTEGFLRLSYLPNVLFLVMLMMLRLPTHGEIARERNGHTGYHSPGAVLSSGILLFSYLERQGLLLSE